MITTETVCSLRASTRGLTRVTYGSLMTTPLAAFPSNGGDGQWVVILWGVPRCVASTTLLAHLATLHPEELDVILDPAISPDEAVMDGEARAKREIGRQAAAAMARQRAADEEEEKRTSLLAARERERMRRVDVTKIDLDDL